MKPTVSDAPVKIEEELDDIVIEYLETLQNYLRSALDEERLLKEGFIDIAHSRMCVKPHLITLDGLSSENTKDLDPSRTVSHSASHTKGSGPERKLEEDSTKDVECRRLFGRNIPASLKTAQSSFHRVIERAVERANILTRLDHLMKRKTELEMKLKNLEANKENASVVESS